MSMDEMGIGAGGSMRQEIYEDEHTELKLGI